MEDRTVFEASVCGPALGLAFVLSAAMTASAAESAANCSPGMTIDAAVDDGSTEYYINMRVLWGVERTLYANLQNEIVNRLGTSEADARGTLAERLVSKIRALPDCVQTDTKEALYNLVAFQLEIATEPVKPAVEELLSSGDEEDQLVGLSALEFSNDAWWTSDPETMHTVLAMVRSSATPSSVRQSILGTMFVSNAFDRVRSLAWSLARDESDPELARAAASKVCGAMRDQDFRRGEVEGAFQTSSGVLRQESALALARFEKTGLAAAIKDDVLSELISMAAADGLSPIVRSEAIVELGRYADQPEVLEALLDLLRPQNWFYGAQGRHHAEHSLTLVVEALAQSHDPAALVHLRQTQGRIAAIDPEARVEVELAFDAALVQR